MVDIGVSMRPQVLEHKREDGRASEGRYCYWSMNRVPGELSAGDKLWVASKGRWRGYFTVLSIEHGAGVDEAGESGGEVNFDSESWVERDGGPRSPFQGFTYRVPGARA